MTTPGPVAASIDALGPVERLLLAEAPAEADCVLLLHASQALVETARTLWPRVRAYADRRDLTSDQEWGDGALPTAALDGVDLVLLVLPPSLTTLDEDAQAIAAGAAHEVRIVAAGRVKHMTRTQNDVLARSFADVRASRGVGKCRALHAALPRPAGQRTGAAWPRSSVDEATGLTLVTHGATFAGSWVDHGTRLLLSTRERWPAGSGIRALDLGCGNGVIAAVLAATGSTVTAIDISRAAVAATRATLGANGLPGTVVLGDGLQGQPRDSQELIVTNPPFHVGAAKDSTAAFGFFAHASRVLTRAGEFWCVYNSHLPYLPALREHFADVSIAARDRSYLVVRAAMPRKTVSPVR